MSTGAAEHNFPVCPDDSVSDLLANRLNVYLSRTHCAATPIPPRLTSGSSPHIPGRRVTTLPDSPLRLNSFLGIERMRG